MEESGRIRPASPADADDVGRLILLSAERFLPAVFGERIGPALRALAARPRTLFSWRRAWIAESGGTTAGMLLGYSGGEKADEDPATGLALFRALGVGLLLHLGRLLSLQRTIGSLARDEWYVSNVAVYPEFRGRGLGRALMLGAEDRASRAGAARIVLDVETDHEPAIGLYSSLGYVVERKTPPLRIGGGSFAFLRLGKAVKGGRGLL